MHKIDFTTVDHGALMETLDYTSQIITVFPVTNQRNRFSIFSIADNQPTHVEYIYQSDIKLTVFEVPDFVPGDSYQLEFIQQPVTQLDHLLDVAVSNPADGQLLEYDTLEGWVNKTVPYLPIGTLSNPLYQGDVVTYDSVTPQWSNSNNLTVWKDLYGLVSIRGAQGNPPTLQPVDSNSRFYEYATSNNALTDFYFEFHIQHDYKIGSDVYFHVHHLTNTNANANLVVEFITDVSLAQLSYAGSTNPLNSKFFQELGGSTTLAQIAHTYDADPQYRHVVSEIQLSSNGGSANTLDSNKINVDSIILVRLRRNAGVGADTATNNYVFVLQADLHYQSARIGTLLRTYNPVSYSFLE